MTVMLPFPPSVSDPESVTVTSFDAFRLIVLAGTAAVMELLTVIFPVVRSIVAAVTAPFVVVVPEPVSCCSVLVMFTTPLKVTSFPFVTVKLANAAPLPTVLRKSMLPVPAVKVRS